MIEHDSVQDLLYGGQHHSGVYSTSDDEDAITLMEMEDHGDQPGVTNKQKQLTQITFTLHVPEVYKLSDEGGSRHKKLVKLVSRHFDGLHSNGTVSFLVAGLEKAKTTKHWHWQGYAQSPKGTHKRISAWVKAMTPTGFPSAWCSETKGTPEQNVIYCTKEGNGNPLAVIVKLGTMRVMNPGKREQEDWEQIRMSASRGEFEKIPAKQMVLYTGNILKLHAMGEGKKHDELDELNNYWIFGPPGTGKSRFARQLVPGLLHLSKAQCDAKLEPYEKNANNKWVDGYRKQEVILIDDFERTATYMAHDIKRLADRYPVNMEAKGIHIIMRPKHVIVTSNYSIEDIWNTDTVCAAAIIRRFKVIELLDYVTALNWSQGPTFKDLKPGQRIKVSTLKIELQMEQPGIPTSQATTSSSAAASTYVAPNPDR